MKKTLPVKINNQMLASFEHALPMSIIYNERKLIPWINENFINISCVDFGKNMNFDYCGNGFIFGGAYADAFADLFYIDAIDYNCCNDINILSAIINRIDNGYYTILILNQKFLSANVNDNIHSSMIYGYDKDKQIFYSLNMDSKGIFKEIEYKFDEIEEAFRNIFNIPFAPENKFPIQFIQLKWNRNNYPFNLKIFNSELKNYINGENSDSNIFNAEHNYWIMRDYLVFGINIYDSYIKACKKAYNGDYNLIYPNFHFLYEHKLNMYEKFSFISKEFNSTEEFKFYTNKYYQVVEYTQQLRLLFLKFNATQNKEILQDISKMLIQIKEDEFEIVTNLYFEIKIMITKNHPSILRPEILNNMTCEIQEDYINYNIKQFKYIDKIRIYNKNISIKNLSFDIIINDHKKINIFELDDYKDITISPEYIVNIKISYSKKNSDRFDLECIGISLYECSMAYNKDIVASSIWVNEDQEDILYKANNILDNDQHTCWRSKKISVDTEYVIIDLNTIKEFNCLGLKQFYNHGPLFGFTVYTSLNNNEWDFYTQYKQENFINKYVLLELESREAQYIKVVFDEVHVFDKWNFLQIETIDVYKK